MTVIVENAPLGADMRAHVAATVLGRDHLGAEQMGFSDFSAMRLDMAGGEFCVNGLRSFAVLLALRGLFKKGDDGIMRGRASCSGLPAPVMAEVAETAREYVFEASIEFILEHPVEARAARPGIDIVFLPGIVHLLLDSSINPMPEGAGELGATAARLRREYGLEEHGAVGCVWWSAVGGKYAINPLVWVREPESLCLENSCGSGSLALAFVQREKFARMEIMQPGGSPLRAGIVEKDGQIHAFVGGTVSLVAAGELFVAPRPQ